eukprot:3182984-Prymnesium_polylepis.1
MSGCRPSPCGRRSARQSRHSFLAGQRSRTPRTATRTPTPRSARCPTPSAKSTVAWRSTPPTT